MGCICDVISKYLRTCAENLFPSILTRPKSGYTNQSKRVTKVQVRELFTLLDFGPENQTFAITISTISTCWNPPISIVSNVGGGGD